MSAPTGRLAGGNGAVPGPAPATDDNSFTTSGRSTSFGGYCWCPVTGRTRCAYLADAVGITEVHAGQSPEQKVEIARRETASANTVFVGDGKEKPRGKPAAETWKPRGLPD